MNKRKNSILSCLLSRYPNFSRTYDNFSSEVVNLVDQLCEQIDLGSFKLIEYKIDYKLQINESDIDDENS